MKSFFASLILVALFAIGCHRDARPVALPQPVPAKRTVKIVPEPGAPTRQEVQNNVIGAVAFLEADAFLSTLERSEASVQEFVKSVPAATEGSYFATYSDWDVRSRDLRHLVQQTVQAMKAQPGAPSPKIYMLEDVMTYPRLHIVWQYPEFHKLLVVSNNNDNDAIGFALRYGAFDAKGTGLTLRKEYPANTDLLSLVPFLEDSATIYPHIERYYVCAPTCETR